MRIDQQPRAEGADKIAVGVKLHDRVGFHGGAATGARATLHQPDRLAVPVYVQGAGGARHASLGKLQPGFVAFVIVRQRHVFGRAQRLAVIARRNTSGIELVAARLGQRSGGGQACDSQQQSCTIRSHDIPLPGCDRSVAEPATGSTATAKTAGTLFKLRRVE